MLHFRSKLGQVLRIGVGYPDAVHRAVIETLENRRLLSTNVLTFHNDLAGDGVNSTETTLSPANVKVGSFGKTATVALDGNVYAQPLVLTSDNITTGPNTVAAAVGVHDVVFVATENDSLYAIDTHSGAILWQRSFLNIGAGAGLTAGTNINNPLGSTAILPPNDNDVQCQDIGPTYGITGTPVIDSTNGIIYLVTFTKETINGTANFVQRLHAISVSNGIDVALPFMLGDTTGSNTNTTPIYVYGDGDGEVTDPYNNTGKDVVQFNALRENQRDALTLVNNTIYIGWASHCDDAPYHGWICSFDVSNLMTSGFALKGVFCSSPNGGEAGIWDGGGRFSFESSGNTFYFETGNGDASGAVQLNSAGFPTTGSYYEAVVKMTVDSTTTPTNQNINGWGLKVVDYFIPSNQPALDNADQDLGSGAPLILPASAGIPGHPDLMIAEGKQGVIYLIDRDNMGHFNPNYDDVVNAYDVGSATPPVAVSGVLSTPVYYNGVIYIVSGYSGPLESFVINSKGTLTETSQSANSSFGYLPGSPALSANGTTGGILWVTDRSSNELHAYDASSLSTELWNSSQKANNADAPGSIDKLNAPTVANGEVFLGTSNSLAIYGLTPPSTTVPNAPVLTGAPLSATSINLSWTDSTTNPNTATSYSVEQLINGTWTPVTTAPGGYTSVAVGGLTLQTTYSFRIRGLNGIGYSAYSNIISVTTSNLAASLNFAYGFAASSSLLTYNGSAKINGTNAELTDGGAGEASSIFSNTPVDVTKFSTVFQFQLTAGSTADGFTFTIQGNSPTALGGAGGGLGYAGDGVQADPIIAKSVAIKFDLYNNAGEGINSTGIYLDGANPTVPAVDLTPSGINLHSGDLFSATLTYDGTTLTETVVDNTTGTATFTQAYTVNIPANTGNTAYVGFTAGTGGAPTVQNILDWTFSPNAPAAPAAPSGLGATVASATSINLTWTNNATNQTGYALDRATDPGFSQNLVTQILPASPSSFTDTYTGLASGGTYYYRIRATNIAGSSVNSNVSSISIPFSPAKATNGQVVSVTTNSISLSWTDNAGTTATGYNILRAVNHGAFSYYAVLPCLNTAPPSQYTWTDTGLTPGVFYDYHIQCFNIAGYNDFTGANATTLTAAPTSLTATAGLNGISLAWTAAAGAAAYNIYRGTTAGGESAVPIATGVTATTYLDTTAAPSMLYYYYVTATNGNLAPINGESAGSNEASATSFPSLSGAVLNYSTGFNNSTSTLTYNGNAQIVGNALQLTTGGALQASSVFSSTPVNVTKFSTSFEFQITAGPTADGFTFCIQGGSPTALGGGGGGLGYAGDGVMADPVIANSIAVKFDLYNNAGEGTDSTGLYLNGANPILPAIDMTSSGLNLHSGDIIQASFSYDGTTLTQTVVDTVTGATFTHAYAVNIPANTGNAAYVGFTGGAGGYATVQNILNWTYTPTSNTVAAPSGLAGAPVSGASVNLTWTNNASTETGYSLDRATNSTFTQNLVTQTLPATPASFTDVYAGLAPGGTYYYRIRAVNGSTSSAASNVATVVIPALPAAATNAKVTTVTTSSIALTWTDNASTSATGYSILRAVNHGVFSVYKSLPGLTATAPSTYSWTDTGLTPGTYYDYEIEAANVAGNSGFVETAATSLTAVPTAVTAVAAVGSINLTWTAPTGAVTFNVYRATTSGGEGKTPLVSGLTTSSYTDASAVAGAVYYYYVTAVNSNAVPLNSESAASAEVSATVTTVKLVGTAIGTAGSWSNDGNTIAQAFDGNLSTFFDPPNGNLTNWAGLDLGYAQTITQIRYAPRAGWEFRMVGGQFQVSSTADFSSNVVTLATITTTPVAGVFTTISVNPGGAYRYVRYVGGTGWVNIAEMEVDGMPSAAPYTKLTGTPIGTAGSWSNDGNTIAQVFDGNLATFFDPPNGNLTNWVGLDLGSPETIGQIKYAPRPGWEFRMVGGQFQVSSTADFSSNVVTLYTITTTPVSGVFTTINVTPGGAYRYVRFVGGTGWVNIAEMEVDGIAAAPPTYSKFTGLPIGTPTSWANNGDTIAQVFDGNFSTFFDAPDGNLSDWVGLDMGYAQTISQIKYAPRAGYEFRMVGGQFQVSNSATFTSGVVTLYTILTAPTAGVWTTINVNPGGAYRYVRYVGGTQWVNIAEMEVDGIPATPPTFTKLTGTAIGTPTSWLNNGDTIAQVFDGNFGTYFDAPNGNLTNWVGLDLGTAQTIAQIKFAPRAGYEFRMVGGQFQVSSTPDFSSNVVTLYTITTPPVAGQFTVVPVSPGGAYRYVRYVGGTQWVNIAEMEVDSMM